MAISVFNAFREISIYNDTINEETFIVCGWWCVYSAVYKYSYNLRDCFNSKSWQPSTPSSICNILLNLHKE